MISIGVPANVREVRRIIEAELSHNVARTKATHRLWAWADGQEVLAAAGDEIWYSIREYGGIPTWRFEPMRAVRIPKE